MKVEPLLYGDRKVFTVASFNRGVAEWLQRLPTLWIEGEITELRRSERWGSVFFTLKDPADGACLPASIPRRTFDALKLDLTEGERIHVLGRPELFAAKGEFRLRALSLERFGLGAHLAAIERLKQALADEGLFDAGPEAAAAAFPAPDRARHRQRRGGAPGRDHDDSDALPARTHARRGDPRAGAARGGRHRRGAEGDQRASPGSTSSCSRAAAAASRTCSRSATSGSSARSQRARYRSSRRSGTSRTRRSATSPPTCAPRRRRRPASSSCPTSKRCGSSSIRARSSLERCVRRRSSGSAKGSADALGARAGARRALERDQQRVSLLRDRLRRGPALLVERRRAALERTGGQLAALSPRATLARGYAIVRAGDAVLRTRTARPGRPRRRRAGRRRVRRARRGRAAVSGADLRDRAEGARADRRPARARQRQPGRSDQALGARRGAAALLPRPARDS